MGTFSSVTQRVRVLFLFLISLIQSSSSLMIWLVQSKWRKEYLGRFGSARPANHTPGSSTSTWFCNLAPSIYNYHFQFNSEPQPIITQILQLTNGYLPIHQTPSVAEDSLFNFSLTSRSASFLFSFPVSSKLLASSQLSNSCFICSHSPPRIEKQRESLQNPFSIISCLQHPSQKKPNLSAALLERSLSLLHFHWTRWNLRSQKAYLAKRQNTSVVSVVLWTSGEYLKKPNSMDWQLGNAFMQATTPTTLSSPFFLMAQKTQFLWASNSSTLRSSIVLGALEGTIAQSSGSLTLSNRDGRWCSQMGYKTAYCPVRVQFQGALTSKWSTLGPKQGVYIYMMQQLPNCNTTYYQYISPYNNQSDHIMAHLNPTHSALINQASTLSGQPLCQFITSLTSNPSLFCYSKFIPTSSLLQLKTTDSAFYNLFTLFCFGDYQTYRAFPGDYPPLSTQQLNKLRQLTILSICQDKTDVEMKDILESVELSPMECVKLLIEMIDLGVLNVSISEEKNKVKVFNAMSRDVKIECKELLIARLDQIILNNLKTLDNINSQITALSNKVK